ncbi:MAG TPA: hypothetical protein VL120_14340 [Solirubrobacteraceae bacterium]|jgi:hypothetical protein|nr:hypothetical protein [Solirubrobacteraceae bacterium]
MRHHASRPSPAADSRATPARPPARPQVADRGRAPLPNDGAELRADGLAGALATSVVQRKKSVNTVAEAAKADLKASIGGKTASECKKRLDKRFPKGPLFSDANLVDILTLEASADGKKWLDEVGIGTYAAANKYLNDADYKQWLKQPSGKRLLIATIAWKTKLGANDANPPPSYTLGRAMAIQTGDSTGTLSPADRALAEQERDEHIRNAFVNTLMPVGDTELTQVQLTAGNDANAIIAANAQAQHILARILLILQAGLQVYDPTQATHVDLKTEDVVRALAHGGRVNIRIPALSGQNKNDDKYALTDWIGITKQGKEVAAVKERGFGTHHMSIGENKAGPGTGRFVEEGGKSASMANKRAGNVKLYGLDLAAGGLGKTDFNGDVILPDGAHGHMFIGFTKPTKTRDGALQIGIETTGPGAPSMVGYKHNWNSTEATANPESSFYGHKMQKVGGGGLATNQRLVDLNKLQADSGKKWVDALDHFSAILDYSLADAEGQERGVYEVLAGPRV